jgi:hypothetical protein
VNNPAIIKLTTTRRPIAGPERVAGESGFWAVMVPVDRRQRMGESAQQGSSTKKPSLGLGSATALLNTRDHPGHHEGDPERLIRGYRTGAAPVHGRSLEDGEERIYWKRVSPQLPVFRPQSPIGRKPTHMGWRSRRHCPVASGPFGFPQKTAASLTPNTLP